MSSRDPIKTSTRTHHVPRGAQCQPRPLADSFVFFLFPTATPNVTVNISLPSRKPTSPIKGPATKTSRRNKFGAPTGPSSHGLDYPAVRSNNLRHLNLSVSQSSSPSLTDLNLDVIKHCHSQIPSTHPHPKKLPDGIESIFGHPAAAETIN